ncbi:hypothetical protein [Salinibaculum rarum]|uniref:DUF7847 domain-containing protein n=1 Tax=Salinibaculum rarum TaxID=3058903 RepID=UPI00265D6A38|nr:hypothetical protein [Salinibaculum sp. KK48]
MGSAIDALDESVQLLTPKIGLVCFGTAVVAMIASFVLAFIPIFGSLVAGVVVAPFFLATTVTMVYKYATDGSDTLSAWVDGLNDYFLTLFGGYALYQIGMFVITLVFGVILLVIALMMGGLGAMASGTGDAMFTVLGALMLLAMLVIGVVMFAIAMVVQFLDVSIVIEGAEILEAYQRAYEIVRDDPVSTVGYTLLRGMIPAVGYAVALVVGAGVGYVTDGTWGIVVGGVIGFGVVAVASAWVVTYHVAYYMERYGDRLEEDDM